MKAALTRFHPVTNKATVVLLTLVIVSFGLFAQSRVADTDPAPCNYLVHSPASSTPLFSSVFFQE